MKVYRWLEKLTGLPWVRWPPSFNTKLRIFPPLGNNARYAAALACEPLWGWTLANLLLNNFHALSIASCSTLSTNSQPP